MNAITPLSDPVYKRLYTFAKMVADDALGADYGSLAGLTWLFWAARRLCAMIRRLASAVPCSAGCRTWLQLTAIRDQLDSLLDEAAEKKRARVANNMKGQNR